MQVMRHDVALALGKSGPNVDVMCTDKEFGGRFMPFAKVSSGTPPVVVLPCVLFSAYCHGVTGQDLASPGSDTAIWGKGSYSPR